MPHATRPASATASAGGAGLAALTRLVAAARPAPKPLHPRGDLVAAVLRRHGGQATGSTFVDEAGVDEVVCRRSRAVGLPATLPDIHGLAVRVPLAAGGHGDLLLASTGTGRLTRFLLLPGRRLDTRPLTTLLPYRSPTGPLLLGAAATSPHTFALLHAHATGPWRRFADLELTAESGPDPLVSFDPVRNPLPGLELYDWVRRLREPSYAAARRSRHADA